MSFLHVWLNTCGVYGSGVYSIFDVNCGNIISDGLSILTIVILITSELTVIDESDVTLLKKSAP